MMSDTGCLPLDPRTGNVPGRALVSSCRYLGSSLPVKLWTYKATSDEQSHPDINPGRLQRPPLWHLATQPSETYNVTFASRQFILFAFISECPYALLIIAFYLQKDVYWRTELGDYRSYVNPSPKSNSIFYQIVLIVNLNTRITQRVLFEVRRSSRMHRHARWCQRTVARIWLPHF